MDGEHGWIDRRKEMASYDIEDINFVGDFTIKKKQYCTYCAVSRGKGREGEGK
jgi:hypothetical protein